MPINQNKRTIVIIIALFFSVVVTIGFISHGFAAGSYRILQWAAAKQHTRTAKLLVAIGAPPSPYKEIYDWYYFSAVTDTPLHWAAKAGNNDLAISLIEHGASVDWCCCSCVTALHRAIRNKHPETVAILLDAGANTEIPYDLQASAIDLARSEGTREIVELIVSHNKRSNRDTAEKRSSR